jgi:hypothetical protein
MATVEVSLEDVTVCAPCDQGAAHPGSHAEDTRILLADRVPEGVPDDVAVKPLVHVVRGAMNVTGPITVHKSPHSDLSTATFGLVHEWVATRP